MTLQELMDREEIRDVVLRYCRGVDRRDWDLVRSCYHPDAYDHHGRFRGNVDEFVDFLQDFLPRHFDATMHFCGNVLIDLDGDIALVESYVVAHHRGIPPGQQERGDMIVGARLHDRMERRDGAWRVAHRELIHDWSRIEPEGAVFALAPGALVGCAGPDDPTYGRDLSQRPD